jgi:hypothetical protein
MIRAACWLVKNVPPRLTLSVASKSASVTASAGLPGAMPALLTVGDVELQDERFSTDAFDLRD